MTDSPTPDQPATTSTASTAPQPPDHVVVSDTDDAVEADQSRMSATVDASDFMDVEDSELVAQRLRELGYL